jgi:SAM-dependent methyltransferase
MFAKLMAALHRPVYEKRIQTLVEVISGHLAAGDRVLDVGCGSGALGGSLIARNGARGITVDGLEKHPRGGEPIHVVAYPGETFPLEENSYDVVIVADVLHHERDPDKLLREAVRVSRRLVIIKDHQVNGPLAYPRIALIDWAANAPYGVPCLYRYNTPAQWSEIAKRFELETVQRCGSMDLYPAGVNLLFGRRLQFLLVGRVKKAR